MRCLIQLMGVTQSKGNSFRWIDRYQLIDIDNNDKVLKLMSRIGQEEYIGKEFVCQGAQSIRQTELIIDHKVMTPSPHLMRLVRVGEKKDTYCSQNKVFYLVFRKPFQTLKEESLNRKFKQGKFNELEIEIVLQSCVKALLYLKNINQFHRNISSSSIFINQDRTIVLGDPWLLTAGTEGSFNLHGYSYPSPQKIMHSNGLIQSYDSYLSDLFTLGVVLLEIVYQQHMDLLYEKGFKRVLDTKIIERVNGLKNQSLRSKLKILLSHQSGKRNSIVKMLEQMPSKQETFISLEKESFRKNYIKNHLQVSQVRTVKHQKINDNHTIINRCISEDRDPLQFSTVTLPDHNILPMSPLIHNSSTTVRNYYNTSKPLLQVPIHLYDPIAANNRNESNHPTVRMVYNENLPVWNQPVRQTVFDRVSFSSIHDNSYRSSGEVMQMNMLDDQKQARSKDVWSNSLYRSNEAVIKSNDPISTFKSDIQPTANNHLPTTSLMNTTNFNRDSATTTRDKSDIQQINTNNNMQYLSVTTKQQTQNNSIIKEQNQQSPSRSHNQSDLVNCSVEYEPGTKYIGQMKQGKREGFGVYHFEDGSCYKGQWFNNQMHGKGQLFYKNNKLAYKGSWYMDCMHGQGKLCNFEPTLLSLPFNYEDMSQIQQSWQDYQGQFFADKKHGRGRLRLTNGQLFVGQFDDNMINGNGKFYRLDGSVVMGEWRCNKMITLN